MKLKSSLVVLLIVAGCGDDAGAGAGASGGAGGATTSSSSGSTGGASSSSSSSTSGSGGGGADTGGAATGGGGAGTGGGGAGTGGGGIGIEEALAACEEWRSGYSAVSLILGCNDPDVDDPTYCDEFATNDCLLESGALWACEAPSFMESNCACVDPKNGPFLDCVDNCGAELQALINCFGS